MHVAGNIPDSSGMTCFKSSGTNVCADRQCRVRLDGSLVVLCLVGPHVGTSCAQERHAGFRYDADFAVPVLMSRWDMCMGRG